MDCPRSLFERWRLHAPLRVSRKVRESSNAMSLALEPMGRPISTALQGGNNAKLRSPPEQPVMRDLYRANASSCKPLGELTEVAMRGPSPFSQGQRELIAAYVSGLNACVYCHGTHAAVAVACGVAPDLRA